MKLYGNNLFKDNRISTLLEEFKNNYLSLEDIVLQSYFIGYEDCRYDVD